MSAVDYYKQRVAQAMAGGDLGALRTVRTDIESDKVLLGEVADQVEGLIKQLQYFMSPKVAAEPSEATQPAAVAAPAPIPAPIPVPEPVPAPAPVAAPEPVPAPVEPEQASTLPRTPDGGIDYGFLDTFAEGPAKPEAEDEITFDFST